MFRPNRLYKYESFSTQALENLKNHSLYFGSPANFNDPYDCAVFPSVREPTDQDVAIFRSHYLAKNDLPDRVREQFQSVDNAGLRLLLLRQGQGVLDDAVAAFLSKRGVTCFSERNDSLLMWGHYGGRFKGFCLEFRTDCDPLTKARKVSYAEEMPQVDLVPLLCNGPDGDAILDLYCTKAFDWHYEREWRCLHNEAGTVYTYPPETLTGVFMGPEAAFASFEIIALIIANQNPAVQLWQGKRSRSEFSVVFEPVTYTSHIEAKRLGRTTGDA